MGKRYVPITGPTNADLKDQAKPYKSVLSKIKKKKTMIDKFRDYSGGTITTESIQRGLASKSKLWRKRARTIAGKSALPK